MARRGNLGARFFAVALASAALLPSAARAEDRPQAFFLLIDTSASMNEVPKPLPGDPAPDPGRAPRWKAKPLDEVKQRLGDFLAALPLETEIQVFTFDETFREGPAVILGADSDRAALRGFFDRLEAKGTRTHAWSSLDRVLARASRYVEASPGTLVRVLVYTDGNDNERPPVSLDAVLARYEPLLKSKVEATYITMGFNLAVDMAKVLEGRGVHLLDNVRPDDLIPLMAILDWEPRRPATSDDVRFISVSQGAIASRQWDFGDGTTSTEDAPRHRYARAGTFVVRLTVRSPAGRTSTASRSIQIAAPEPLRALGKATPQEVPAGTPVQFVNESRGAIASFAWDFGDGSGSGEANPVHVYERPGTYRVGLTVRGTEGGSASWTLDGGIRVVGPAPPEAAILGPTEASVGEAVLFLDGSRGLVESRTWDFGDGTPPEASAEPRHAFARAGSFEVRLVVRGPGGEATATRAVSVRPPPAPTAAFVIGPSSPRQGEEAVLTDLSTGPVDRVVWSFDDGSPDVARDYATSEDPNVRSLAKTFGKAGPVLVRIEASGPGGSGRAERRVEVLPRDLAPEAAFTADPSSGRVPLEVAFTNRSRGTVRRYVWDFGDGSAPVSTTDPAPLSHRYERPGTYEVTLTAEGPPEYPVSTSRPTRIVVEPPPGWLAGNWPWVLPAALAALAGLVLLRRSLRRRAALASLRLLSGTVLYRLPGGRWTTVAVPTPMPEFSFAVTEPSAGGPPRQVVVRAEVDASTGEREVIAEVRRGESVLGRGAIPEGRVATIQGIEFQMGA